LSKIRVLNLYGGIGGNRKLWPSDKMDVTTVEIDPKVAKIYSKFFPDDKVVIEDAHKFLLDHFQDFDFIWSSPPCPTHSVIRKCYVGRNNDEQNPPVYPNMELYEEILFLMGYFRGKWVVENVVSWYEPLIRPFVSGRHYFWANFYITNFEVKSREHYGIMSRLERLKGFDLSGVGGAGVDKRVLLRNCVEPELGLYVFKCAFGKRQMEMMEFG
jgi:DNA (cytosine-5)-methyltransferase 1